MRDNRAKRAMSPTISQVNRFDSEEWENVLGKMVRYHFNISEEIKLIVMTIRKEMKSDLIPLAEEKASHGKEVKRDIRKMWDLEYEIADIQMDFAKCIGGIDIHNLTDDFVEDVMLQSKPLQGILALIRGRQKELMETIKNKYGELIEKLEPMEVTRPNKKELIPEKEEVPKPAETKVEQVQCSPPAEVSA